jgi:hypothetical protein
VSNRLSTTSWMKATPIARPAPAMTIDGKEEVSRVVVRGMTIHPFGEKG